MSLSYLMPQVRQTTVLSGAEACRRSLWGVRAPPSKNAETLEPRISDSVSGEDTALVFTTLLFRLRVTHLAQRRIDAEVIDASPRDAGFDDMMGAELREIDLEAHGLASWTSSAPE